MKHVVENNLGLLSLVYFVKVIHQREVIGILQKVRNVRGLFLFFLKQGNCALHIKAARDQENTFHFELCVNKV